MCRKEEERGAHLPIVDESNCPFAPRTTLIRRCSLISPPCGACPCPCPLSDENLHHESPLGEALSACPLDVGAPFDDEPEYPVDPDEAEEVVEAELERASPLWPCSDRPSWKLLNPDGSRERPPPPLSLLRDPGSATALRVLARYAANAASESITTPNETTTAMMIVVLDVPLEFVDELPPVELSEDESPLAGAFGPE